MFQRKRQKDLSETEADSVIILAREHITAIILTCTISMITEPCPASSLLVWNPGYGTLHWRHWDTGYPFGTFGMLCQLQSVLCYIAALPGRCSLT